MNRDELLDKLSMELAEWPIDVDHAVSILPDYVGMRFPCREITHPSISPFAEYQIGEQQWLQRRKELINCPPDSDAPEWAEWKAQDADGWWCWFAGKPAVAGMSWHYDEKPHQSKAGKKGETPNGHRWQDTLAHINRDDNTSTPEEDEEFERIQARQDADKPHEADARMLDSQLADAMGKQPRYLDATGEDWIDEFTRTATLDEFRGAMRFTIGKYNRRVGRKDEILNEVRKMKDYCARWEAYELALAAKDRGK